MSAAAVAGARHASTLVVAEHSAAKGTLSASTLSTITAAGQFKGPITVLVAGGQGMDAVAKQAAQVAGVSKVLVAEHAAYEKGLAENVCQAIVAAHKAGGYSHILAPSSMRSKNILPRVAALLDTQPVTDVIQIVDEATFVRPMYAGNAIATVKTSEPLKILTVRATAFDKAAATGGSATTEAAPAVAAPDAGLSTFVSENVSQSARPELASARVVISGGRGLKTKENFAMLETLADKLKGAGTWIFGVDSCYMYMDDMGCLFSPLCGAFIGVLFLFLSTHTLLSILTTHFSSSPPSPTVGASRAAVDEYHMPNELQVGQTGKVVAPDLYVAVGISGAIQHLSGMKDSKVIVAINKDKEAPIFQVADYGLVADLFQAVPDLTKKI